ncbi:hypothetical protein QTP88_008052 [Uroleucon formosanum]
MEEFTRSVLTTNRNDPHQPLSSTMKQNCSAFIYIRVTSDGSKLEIARMDESHNHFMSSMLFSNLPNQRRLARKASIQTAKLAELLSEVFQFSFERRICQLQQMVDLWGKNKDFLIEEIETVVTRCIMDQVVETECAISAGN